MSNLSKLGRLLPRLALAACAGALAQAAFAAPTSILFVGNSYTFGRVDPVMSYNAANVHDLTAGFNTISSAGSNPWEPHPWGGIAGLFKQFAVQKGLDYDVSISARNAASLRGQYLNTANAAWDLRGNVASRPWDIVVLQEQSDAALPVGSGERQPGRFPRLCQQVRGFRPRWRCAELHRDRAVRRPGRVRRHRPNGHAMQYGAQDRRQSECQPECKGLSDRNLGSPRHGVRASRHQGRHDVGGRAAHQRGHGQCNALLSGAGRHDRRPACGVLRAGGGQSRLRRRAAGGRRLTACAGHGAGQGRRFLRCVRRLCAEPAGRPDEPVVGRLSACEQIRLLPRCAGAVRRDHGFRSAFAGQG